MQTPWLVSALYSYPFLVNCKKGGVPSWIMDFKVVNGVNISTCEIKFGIILKFVVINKKKI